MSLESRAKQLQGERSAWRFGFDDSTIAMYDLVSDTENGVSLHCGLGFDCWIEAENQSEAIRNAKRYTEFLVTIASFTTQTSASPSKTLIVYDASEGDQELREFYQEIHTIRAVNGNLISIDNDLFGELFEHSKEADSRIQHSLQLLRKALNEEYDFDQFIEYWIGLDSLSKLLLEKLIGERSKRSTECPDCNEEIKFCPHCGESTSRVLPTYIEGLKKHFENELGIDSKSFDNKWYKNRNRVFHGGKDLTPGFMQEIAQQIPLLRKALIWGISELLDLSTETRQAISVLEPRRGISHFLHVLEADLKNHIPDDLSHISKQPFVEITKGAIEFTVSQDFKLNIHNATQYTFRNASFNVKSIGVKGHGMSGLSSDDLVFQEDINEEEGQRQQS